MNYKIKAFFNNENEAKVAASVLRTNGFKKEFTGYTQNANIQPESLVEDHYIRKNSVTVFTPNLNRAFKAKNLMAKIGAVSTKMKTEFSGGSIKAETKTAIKNILESIQSKIPNYSIDNR